MLPRGENCVAPLAVPRRHLHADHQARVSTCECVRRAAAGALRMGWHAGNAGGKIMNDVVTNANLLSRCHPCN